MQRILVIGAGAMGCLFAARIAECGAQVMLIDVDRDRLARIADQGISLTDDKGTRTIPLATGVASDATGPFDLILLFTKGMHSRAAIQSIAHLAAPSDAANGPIILTLQNGLGNPEIIAQTFAPTHILKGIAALPADLHDATSVSSHGSGHIELGGMTPQAHRAAHDAAALLCRAGFDARMHETIDVAIWEKLAFNATLNALATITLQRNAGMNNAPGQRIIAAMVSEVVATAHACQIPIDRARIDSAITFALTHHGTHQASMLQDRLAGRPSEIDFINGAVCAHAAQHGIATPVMNVMTDLVRMIELAGNGG